MAQQTAVEWLIKEIELGLSEQGMKNVFEKAKQMEKEQIIKAHNNAVVSPYTDLHVWETNGKTQITKGEQYYNETYNKNK